MHIRELEGKTVLILGYGREGRATEAFLKKFVPSATIVIADKELDANYLEKQHEADVVVKTPGIRKELVTAPYTTATNIFFANTTHQIIGVTGSKGKSTTAALIAAILREAGRVVHFVGNIGVPALSALCESIGKDDLFVMELSSQQLDDIEYSPHISVVTSLFPEHLDYHGTVENYFAAKAKILAKATHQDYYVYNPTYPELFAFTKATRAQSVPFQEEIPFSLDDVKLMGSHNEWNMRGALTVANLMEIDMAVAERAIKAFEPLPHRLMNVGTYRGITFYDDAIATAPEPTLFAIDTLKLVDTIFLGGTDRGLTFDDFATVIKQKGIRNIVLFPDTGRRIKEALEKTGGSFVFLETESMKEAVAFAYEKTAPGKICLLSTASPSYRLWKNFEEKGDEFTRWVKEMGT